MQTSYDPSSFPLSTLLQILNLKQGPTERTGATVWFGEPQPVPTDRVFGGLQLAQAVVAAGRTVPEDQEIITLQADFLSGVPTDRPLKWHVENITETAAFSTRRSNIVDDDGRLLFTALTRWGKVRSDLPSYFPCSASLETEQPSQLPSLQERYRDNKQIPLWWRMNRPINVHPVSAPPYIGPTEPADRQSTWLHASGTVPGDAIVQAALAGYVTDMSILEPAFRATGSVRHAPGSRILTLTHTLTFHQIPAWHSWLRFDAELESLSHGRALGNGKLFDLEGRHLVSASQVGFVKFGDTVAGFSNGE